MSMLGGSSAPAFLPSDRGSLLPLPIPHPTCPHWPSASSQALISAMTHSKHFHLLSDEKEAKKQEAPFDFNTIQNDQRRSPYAHESLPHRLSWDGRGGRIPSLPWPWPLTGSMPLKEALCFPQSLLNCSPTWRSRNPNAETEVRLLGGQMQASLGGQGRRASKRGRP